MGSLKNGPENNGNEGDFHIPQCSRIRASSSDGLVLYSGHSLAESLIFLQRCNQCILQPQLTGLDRKKLNALFYTSRKSLFINAQLVGLRIHWQYPLQRSKTLPKPSVLGMTQNSIWWWDSSSGALESIKSPLHWHCFLVHTDLNRLYLLGSYLCIKYICKLFR